MLIAAASSSWFTELVPIEPLPGGGHQPTAVGESLDRVVRHLGAPRAMALHAVFARWSELVGSSVATHVVPVGLRDHTLLLAVDEPAWATQVRFLRGDLLAALDEALGTGVVADFSVRVDPEAVRTGGVSDDRT